MTWILALEVIGALWLLWLGSRVGLASARLARQVVEHQQRTQLLILVNHAEVNRLTRKGATVCGCTDCECARVALGLAPVALWMHTKNIPSKYL